MKLRLFKLVFCASLTSILQAQSLPVLMQFVEPQAVSGSEVYDLGDVDGDGCDDFGLLALAPDPVNPGIFLGKSSVVSGRTGLSIHDLHTWGGSGLQNIRFFRLPDLDGDGMAEFATESPTQHISAITSLSIHSGATGLILGSSFLPASFFVTRVSTLGDVTGDGIPDLGIAMTQRVFISYGVYLPVSFIDVVDGATFAKSNIVTYLNAELPSGGLVGLGDVNGDGFADFASSSGLTSIVAANGGTATVYSGQTGQEIRTWFGLAGDGLGQKMVAMSDLDGDSALELAIFSPGSDVAAIDAGRVEILSTGLGNRLVDILPVGGEQITDLTAAGDHDGDGFKDLVVEFRVVATSTVRREIRSGFSGVFIAQLLANEVAVGDLNGDHIDDLLGYVVGQPTPSQTRYTARSLMGAQAYGNVPNSPILSWVPGAIAPANGALKLSGATAFGSVVGVVSFAPANTVVNGTNLPLLVSELPTDLYGLFFDVADSLGGHQDFINLAQPGLAGIRVYVQYGVLTMAPLTTNAVALMFGPF